VYSSYESTYVRFEEGRVSLLVVSFYSSLIMYRYLAIYQDAQKCKPLYPPRKAHMPDVPLMLYTKKPTNTRDYIHQSKLVCQIETVRLSKGDKHPILLLKRLIAALQLDSNLLGALQSSTGVVSGRLSPTGKVQAWFPLGFRILVLLQAVKGHNFLFGREAAELTGPRLSVARDSEHVLAVRFSAPPFELAILGSGGDVIEDHGVGRSGRAVLWLV
jgi:hypothetical protein